MNKRPCAENELKKSYFPLMICLTKTGENMVVKEPADIPSGVAFKVVQTNVIILDGERN